MSRLASDAWRLAAGLGSVAGVTLIHARWLPAPGSWLPAPALST